MRNLFIASVLLFITGSTAGAAPHSLWKGAQKVQLDNGLTVIIKENHSLPVVSVQVWVKVGSVNETKNTTGLSHFLEHLIFKGSEKYPGPEIAKTVETQGGVINAATSKEFTQFYIDIQESGWREAVRILADTMANAVFPPEEIEKERPVVIEEIRRHEDNPGAVLYDLFNEAVFRETPYHASIIGSSTVIANVTRDEIASYYHAHYTPEKMVLSIAGDVRPQEALQLVRETFGKQPKQAAPEEPRLIEPMHQAQSLRREKEVEHEYWYGGFVGPDLGSDDQFAADVAATVLGGGRSSRLFRKLREEKRLVYSIGSSFWSQRGSGAMVFSAVFEPKKEKDALDAASREIALFIDKGPTETEIKRVKEMIKAQWYFGLESFHDQASTLGYWQMQGRPEMVDIYIDRLEKVTAKDVTGFMKKYFTSQGLSQAFLEPAK
ncbi:MAG: M16 family metallopeptidase [Endomicrobiales bacterium]